MRTDLNRLQILGMNLCQKLCECKFIIIHDKNRDDDKDNGITHEIWKEMAKARAKGDLTRRELYASITFSNLFTLSQKEKLDKNEIKKNEEQIYDNALIWGYIHLTKSIIKKYFRLKLKT